MRIYISGKISGLDYSEAYSNFELIELKLRSAGVTSIFNPMKEISKDLPWNTQMDICLKEIPKCNVVVFQHNWKESIGARWEFAEAARHKIHIRYDRPDDYRDIETQIKKRRSPCTL